MTSTFVKRYSLTRKPDLRFLTYAKGPANQQALFLYHGMSCCILLCSENQLTVLPRNAILYAI